jgi:excisionase family DNA binding protein
MTRRRAQDANGMWRSTPLPLSVQTTPQGGLVVDLGPVVDAIAAQVEARVARLLQAEHQTANNRGALTIAEAAQALRVSEATVARLLRDGALDSVKVGARRVISWVAIESYLGRQSLTIDEHFSILQRPSLAYQRHSTS